MLGDTVERGKPQISSSEFTTRDKRPYHCLSQKPLTIATILPPTLEEVSTLICVIFVGSSPPTADWLQTKAKPLCVQKEKVRKALEWLKKHNPHYKDIKINEQVL
jgi:hypothetical protein